jgi:hypothetical protein
MTKKILYILMAFIGLSLESKAQLIDYIQIYAGSNIFPKNQHLNALQLPESFYAGFAPGQVIGGSLFRQVTDHVCIGAGLELSNTSKPHFNLNMNTINVHGKYNFNNIESFISPYVIGGIDISLMNINQQKIINPTFPDSIAINNQPKNVETTQITYRESYTNLYFVPVLGAHVGAGLEFKITEGWGIYGQYTLNYSFTKFSPILSNTFEYNKSNMYYQNLTAGIRFFL